MHDVKNKLLYHFSDNILEKDTTLLIDDNYNSLIKYNMVDREVYLEQIRQKYFKDYISRLHALYCCDINSLRYWHRNLNNPYLYLMELDGTIFTSYARHIPFDSDSDLVKLKKSLDYWNSVYESSSDVEYLFQGKAKVFKRLI